VVTLKLYLALHRLAFTGFNIELEITQTLQNKANVPEMFLDGVTEITNIIKERHSMIPTAKC
jgi:hypothetical protein